VRSRTGIDLDPIDVSSDAGALALESFVWADQTERLRRLDAAIAAARADPPVLVQGDIAAALPELLDGLGDSSALALVWETAVLGYLPVERRARVYDAVLQAVARRPVAFVQTRRASSAVMAHYGMTLQVPPDDRREELAFATHHGDWLDWLER
jgi:hypothetical protein